MNKPPRVVYAQRNQRARIHVPDRYLPIIVLPGIMGTRLSDPEKEDKLVWNPMGEPIGKGPGLFAADGDRIAQVGAPLNPDEKNYYKRKSQHDRYKHIKHYYNLIPEFYGELVESLSEPSAEMYKRRVMPRVYCCGYDWRQDNARSAMRLAEIVDEALRDTGEKKVIIVAHSMGGLVARYYSRVLGGESKIARMILLGSPSLGAPGAYVQLKNGPNGIYFKDLAGELGAKSGPPRDEDGDEGGVVFETVNATTQLITGIVTGVTQKDFMGFVKGFLGDLYLAFSLGMGKLLTRREARYFIRQLTSVYQLLPNSLLCRKYPHWLVFDPFTTGYRPAGPLVIFPSLLDLPLLIASGIGHAIGAAAGREVDKFRQAVEEFLGGKPAGELSARAKRQAGKLEELIPRAIELLGSDEEGASTEAIEIFLWIYEQAERAFFDGRDHKKLYNDIYTGLMDIVSQRPLVAGNLELAYRFDEALTINYRVPESVNLLSLVKSLLKPLGPLLSRPSLSFPSDATPSAMQQLREEHQKKLDEFNDEQAMEKLKDEEKERVPKLYFHRDTVVIYCKTIQGESGSMLFPLKVFSRDDSNVAKAAVLPTWNALPAIMLPDAIESPLLLGDGTVPEPSANPPEEFCEWIIERRAVPNAPHGPMANNPAVMDEVKFYIDSAIEYYFTKH